MDNQPNNTPPKIIIPGSNGINYTGISHNTDTHVINITEDKLYRIIKDHHQALKKSRDWVTYFGILLSLLASLTASSFNEFIFTATTWKTIFISAAAIFFVSTIAAGWARLRDKPVTPKVLVDKIAGRIKFD